MDIITIHSWWTVAMLILFIGIWAWAWSSKRKDSFEESARMALDDDEDLTASNTRVRENKHG